MSTEHTADGSAGYVGVYTIPEDGPDARTANSVNVPIVGVANDLKATREAIMAGTGISRKKAFSPIFVPDPAFSPPSDTWLITNSGRSAQTRAGVVTASRQQLRVPLFFPDQSILTSIIFYMQPAAETRSAVPELRARVIIQSITHSTDATTDLITFTDVVALGTYNNRRQLGGATGFGTDKRIDNSAASYHAILETEGGDDAFDEFTWWLYYDYVLTVDSFDKALGG